MLAVTQILMVFYYLIVPRNWWINIFSLATSYVALVLYIQLFLPILICLTYLLCCDSTCSLCAGSQSNVSMQYHLGMKQHQKELAGTV